MTRSASVCLLRPPPMAAWSLLGVGLVMREADPGANHSCPMMCCVVLFCRVSPCPSLVPVRRRRGPPGGEGAAVQPGHQPDGAAAGGQGPGGPSHHPVGQVSATLRPGPVGTAARQES